MGLRRVRHFDQVKQFDTSGLGGQSAQSSINSTSDYRATNGGGEIDLGLSPSNVNPRGLGSVIRKKYIQTQTAQLNTTEAPGTKRDFLDESRAYNP